MSRVFDGYALRAQRRAAGLSVPALAGLVGRSSWALYAYEQGKAAPPLAVADALAAALAVDLDALLLDADLAGVA